MQTSGPTISRQEVDAQLRASDRPIMPANNEIPYDYVAEFTFAGTEGNRVQGVLNITVDGAFVAVSIGYGFNYRLDPDQQFLVIRTMNLEDIPGGAEGFRPEDLPEDPVQRRRVLDERALTLLRLHALIRRMSGLDFRYRIIDGGSGRELQNLAVHNIAGLGNSDGDRPFRNMARPVLFKPRSTIRIEVEELRNDPLARGGTLSMVFHGYKLLGYQAL